MSDFLFAYGTLQPGHAPAQIASAVEKLLPIGEAFVSGILYDLGGHPGAVLDSSSQERIIGIVYQLPEDASVRRAAAYKTPCVLKYPHTDASRAFKRIASQISGVEYEEEVSEPKQEGFVDRLARARPDV